MSERMQRHYVKRVAPSQIRGVWGTYAFPFAQSHPVEDYPPASQAVIIQTISEEQQARDLDDYTYLFAQVPPCLLPISAWERPWERIGGICDATLTRILQDIQKVEQFLASGYLMQYPLLLTAYNNGQFAIDGGHHRLQAVRNLMRRGKFPPEFQVPVIVRFRKFNFGYQKLNYFGLIDYPPEFEQWAQNPPEGKSPYFYFTYAPPARGTGFLFERQGNLILIKPSPGLEQRQPHELATGLRFIQEKVGPRFIFQVFKY